MENKSEKYKITLFCNDKIIRFNGFGKWFEFTHVWIRAEEESSEEKHHFDFNSKSLACAVTGLCLGTFSDESYLEKRPFTHTITFDVSKEQYENIKQEAEQTKKGNRIYNIILNNCVTNAREMLNAGGIPFLDDVSTPMGVAAKINGDPKYKAVDRKYENYGIFFYIFLLLILIMLMILKVCIVIRYGKKVVKAVKRKFVDDPTAKEVIKKMCI